MNLKHLNIKPKVFPVPSSGMASSTSPLYLRRKKKRLALRERRFSNTTDYVLVQNSLLDWMASEKACYGSQHESAKVNKCNENRRHFSLRQKKRKIFWYSYDRVYMTICENGRWYVLSRSRPYLRHMHVSVHSKTVKHAGFSFLQTQCGITRKPMFFFTVLIFRVCWCVWVFFFFFSTLIEASCANGTIMSVYTVKLWNTFFPFCKPNAESRVLFFLQTQCTIISGLSWLSFLQTQCGIPRSFLFANPMHNHIWTKLTLLFANPMHNHIWSKLIMYMLALSYAWNLD